MSLCQGTVWAALEAQWLPRPRLLPGKTENRGTRAEEDGRPRPVPAQGQGPHSSLLLWVHSSLQPGPRGVRRLGKHCSALAHTAPTTAQGSGA